MNVIKVFVTRMPASCLTGCPVSHRFIDKGDCGKVVKKELEDDWVGQFKAPDERCLCEVVSDEEDDDE